MKYGEYLKNVATRIRVANLQCRDPHRHASQILEFLQGWDRSQIAIRLEEELPEALHQRAEAFLSRRLTGEPFQYIAGEEGFWKSRFEVGPGVLIPRRETEFVVECLIHSGLPAGARIAELGAGSGNIGVSVLLERPHWEWYGYEKNPQSLPYLKKNVATILPSSARYHIVAGDFFEEARKGAPWDAVVSNPPYVSEAQMSELSLEVRCEPKLALEAGFEGLDILEKLIPCAAALLKSGGLFVTEIDFQQSDKVRDFLLQNRFVDVRVIEDYSHRPRVVAARKE